ncbi:MAG: tyrosine-protein phosphatase [Acidimicrobiales bacterium]
MPTRFNLLTRLADNRLFVPLAPHDALSAPRINDLGDHEVEIASVSYRSYGRQHGIELHTRRPLVHPLVERDGDSGTTIHLQRHVTGTTLTNLRDAGAYIGTHGVIQPGKLFRSENLSKLTTPDVTLLQALGIRTVIDLRDDREAANAPTPAGISEFAEIVRLPMTGTICGHDDAIVALSEGKIASIRTEDMTDMYISLLDHYQDQFLMAARTILTHTDGSVLVHCTAGKDRTGLVIALTHLALGVGDYDIFEDFAVSNLYRTPVRLGELAPRIAEWGAKPEQVWPYLSAPVPALVTVMPLLRELATSLHATDSRHATATKLDR